MMVGGFFQSWNGFMNGSMVPFPDKSVEVTTTEAGVHLHGTSTSLKPDEDFDKNMLLTQVVVDTPTMKAVAMPTYVRTNDGLVVSAVASQINQPPSAPPIEVTFRVEYAKVESFQIPLHLVYDVMNVGVIEIGFNTCVVSVLGSAEKSLTRPKNLTN
jgi:hypothetical protein